MNFKKIILFPNFWILTPGCRLLLLGFCVGIYGCGQQLEMPKSENPPASHPAKTKDESSVVTAPVDYIAGTIKAGQDTKGTIERTVIQKALEAFHAEEGRFPESLDEMVKKSYLSTVPPPPAGKKFDYDPQTGKFEINAKTSE